MLLMQKNNRDFKTKSFLIVYKIVKCGIIYSSTKRLLEGNIMTTYFEKNYNRAYNSSNYSLENTYYYIFMQSLSKLQG